MTSATPRARIGIDVGTLVFPAGGVRRYVRELLNALPEAAQATNAPVDFVAVGTPAGSDLPASLTKGPGIANLPTNLARAVVSLPWAVGRAALDLFHAPAYTSPLVGTTPVVVTIHDVSYARRPEFYAHPAGHMRQWFYRRSALRAARIITDSVFSQREITAAYDVPASRIAVVPLGVGAPFTAGGERDPGPDPSTRPNEAASLRASGPGLRTEGVRQPYFLHVGDLHPRRNVEMAARAVVEISRGRAAAGGAPVQLVCAGTDSGSAAAVRAVFNGAGLPGAVCLTGAVSENELLALYRGASAFVYPSRYEGFGLPVLEAMACGIPVVALRAGSVPEVLGDAGILVDEGDDRGFIEALTSLLARRDLAVDLAERGAARARAFTWARTARETMAVYLDCLGVQSGARSR